MKPSLLRVLRIIEVRVSRRKDGSLHLAWDYLPCGAQAEMVLKLARLFHPKSRLTSKGLSGCVLVLS